MNKTSMQHLIRRITALCLLAVSACSPDPSLRARDTRDGTGLPRQYPPGTVAAFPPADNSFKPLRCTTEGPNTECTRN